jgi:hypothetical protein
MRLRIHARARPNLSSTCFADMRSLVSSADATGHDRGRSLTDVFRKLADRWPGERLPELLPHRWRALQ